MVDYNARNIPDFFQVQKNFFAYFFEILGEVQFLKFLNDPKIEKTFIALNHSE